MALVDHFQTGFIKLNSRSMTEKWTCLHTKLPSQTFGHRHYSGLGIFARVRKNLLVLGNTPPSFAPINGVREEERKVSCFSLTSVCVCV